MPPIPRSLTPRIVVYYQTHHTPLGVPISILPLITRQNISVTHIILAALHMNGPDNITLNDHTPHHPRNQTLWAELSVLRASGIKVLGMLGGAAPGSFDRLDGSDSSFEEHYIFLRDTIRACNFDGLDLDVEQAMSLQGIIRLIDRLKLDFGNDFIITLAPVAAALTSGDSKFNLSGFDYKALEVLRGSKIAWYNTQFYCNWGDMHTTLLYDAIIARGFSPSKVVAGLITNPENGAGFVPFENLRLVLGLLRDKYGPGFAGVMGWEYFNSMPGGKDRPWEWASFMTVALGRQHESLLEAPNLGTEKNHKRIKIILADQAEGAHDEEAVLPASFEYFTDGSADG